ncbi:PLC-like phosphodiesterase [Diplogelasinospora grovesii]|uniref:PLC-like phosphodiesterase n=1 Tax=Diplogelasinospora grovesii TaxID=303347 RepID=A0AAN6S194_9PEZI|nr:PLC-like phosphodiesterase [Diplogelasinospora grovesii]
MPSKGVQAYTYIAVPGCSIELSVPKQTIVRNELNYFWNGDMEVDARNISSFFDKTGRFTFKVLQNGNLITEQWIDVNAITGNASSGTMNTIANTPSVLHANGVVVTYGFYEAGPGHGLLPDRHQCYVTVSPNYANWMATVAPPGSQLEGRPFSRLVLPAVHDVGMNSMQSSEAVLRKVGGAIVSTLVCDNKIMSEIADAVSGPAIALIAPNIIFSLAITQKDNLDTMMQIGARYFEFRPAHCHKAVIPSGALPDRLYFQHSAIPGMAYDAFLHDVVQFLLAHPTEIIVVQLRWDGVPPECARPSDQEQREYLDAALREANGQIIAGGLDDLRQSTIGQLRRDRKRLIMLVNVDSLSTYTDAGNATLNGDSIVSAFPAVLTASNAAGKGFINIQCQATATNIPKAVVYSILEASTTTSCLLATKAICDSKTLPWCRDNVLATCGRESLVVMMNDFLDGATADVAVQLSRKRLE